MKQFSFLILALIMLAAPGSAGAQCTISNGMVTSITKAGNVATFTLQFKHIRNSGNKWVTIHLWASTNYPGYNYNNPPTTTSLGGQVPLGTLVIDNSVVSASGTYTAAQAFATIYQNDATFIMATSAVTTLIYDATHDLYTLPGLSITLPVGTSTVQADCWSSQANTNQVVHCFSKAVFPVPINLPVTGTGSFSGKYENGVRKFVWSTKTEESNSHFQIEQLREGEWITVGVIASRYEDGNSTTLTSYSYEYKPMKISYGAFGIGALVLVFALMFRRQVPMVISGIAFMAVCTLSTIGCKKQTIKDDGKTLKVSEWYRLRQFDLNGQMGKEIPMVEVKYTITL